MTTGGPRPGLDADIFPREPRHAVPDPLPLEEFKPWHLPRKQWVRRHQWAECARRLLTKLAVDRPVRYLGLPGTELLDLEVLAGVCADAGKTLRFLGFNTGSQNPGQRTTQQLAEDALKSMSAVDSRSFIATDDILALASRMSMATRRLSDFESFDVINFDLCDVFTTRQGKPVHEAVKNILEFQVNRRTQPWLLFVTVVVDRAVITEADIQKYERLFAGNIEGSKKFGEGLCELAGVAHEASEDLLRNPFRIATSATYGRLLAVGIGKWLLSLLRGPPWILDLKSCVAYRRGMSSTDAEGRSLTEPELFSLVFGLRRPVQRLSDAVAFGAEATTEDSLSSVELEQRSANQIVRKVCRTIDLDVHMQRNTELRNTLTQESADMLAIRNYDAMKYREWAGRIVQLPG